MEEKELLEFEDPKIEELYLDFLEQKEKKDDIEISESLLLFISSLESSGDYKTIISFIEDNFELIKLDNYKIKIINKKVSALLKLEEFNELLKTLEFKSTFLGLDNIEKTNILFYKSIAYEALDEIELSIKSLESIVDNISRYTLVNKYLKLAILYLKVGRVIDAKNAYDYAVIMDHTKKNDMFILVESDLFYASKKYKDALDSYQSFFLKSPNKYKYLDRYILINIKLNRLDEAYNFYNSYKDRESLKISTQNRYSFFKAAKELLKLLGKEDELSLVNASLENLKPIYFNKVESETLSLISLMTSSMSYPLTRYNKYKNIANKFFKLLKDIDKNTLVFVEKCDKGYLYSKYNGVELKEKEISFDMLKNKELIGYFDIKKDTILESYYDHNLNLIEEEVKVYRIESEYKDYGYFFVSYNETYDALYSVLRNILLELFTKLDVLIKESNTKNNLIDSISNLNYGFISISSLNVELFSSKSMELLGFTKPIIPFDEFKRIFDFDIYPSDFIRNNEQTYNVLIGNKNRDIKFNINEIDGKIYAIISDVTEQAQKEKEFNDFYYHSGTGFKNKNALKEFVENNELSYSLLGFYLPVVEETDTLSKRDNKLNAIYKMMKSIIDSDDLYYLGDNHFMYLSLKTDKRILDSIYQRTYDNISKLYKHSYSLRTSSLTGFMSKALKNKTFTEVCDLIEYGFYFSFEKNEFITLDNDEKKNYAIYKTYEVLVANMVRNNELEIEYYPIIDKNNSIHYFLTKYHLPFDISYKMFERILSKNDLESKADYGMIEKVFENSKELNQEIRYIIPIHKESVTNTNFVKKLSLLYKSTSLIGKVTLQVENYDFESYLKGLESLKNASLNLSSTYKDIESINNLKLFKSLFINVKDEEDELYNRYQEHMIKGIKEVFKKEVIVISNKVIDGALNLRSDINIYTKEKLLKL